MLWDTYTVSGACHVRGKEAPNWIDYIPILYKLKCKQKEEESISASSNCSLRCPECSLAPSVFTLDLEKGLILVICFSVWIRLWSLILAHCCLRGANFLICPWKPSVTVHGEHSQKTLHFCHFHCVTIIYLHDFMECIVTIWRAGAKSFISLTPPQA